MLGLSRLAYQLGTNRQIPSMVGRLHPTRATPYVVITVAAILAIALFIPADLDFPVRRHLRVRRHARVHPSPTCRSCACGSPSPTASSPYRMPLTVRGASPLPAAAGASDLVSACSSACSSCTTRPATSARLDGGRDPDLRRLPQLDGKPVFPAVVVPEVGAARGAERAEYGSILVRIFGAARRRHRPDRRATCRRRDRRRPRARARRSRRCGSSRSRCRCRSTRGCPTRSSSGRAGACPREGGRGGVRGRRGRHRDRPRAAGRPGDRGGGTPPRGRGDRHGGGGAVPDRGGALLGGRGGPRDNFVGEVTKYVCRKAPCRVILTAPRARGRARPPGAP